MRGVAPRLVTLLAAGLLGLGLGEARTHANAGGTRFADFCTAAGSKAPAPASDAAGHCECCASAPAAAPSTPRSALLVRTSESPAIGGRVSVRVVPVVAAQPRGPPVVSSSSFYT